MTTAERNSGQSRAGYHRLATYATCPQRFAYREKLGLEPLRTREPLALGSLLHLALMHRYLKLGGAVDALDPVDAMRTAPPRIAWCFDRAASIYAAYCARWDGHENWMVLDVEREFEVTCGGYLYTQRADLVVLDGGAVWIVDHKCQGSVTDANVAAHGTAGQMVGYQMLGAAVLETLYRAPFGGVLINAISTTTPPKFLRKPIQIPARLVSRHASAVAEISRSIELDAARDPWHYRMNLEACQDRWGLCDYQPLCLRGHAALDEFMTARDVGSQLREGSGR